MQDIAIEKQPLLAACFREDFSKTACKRSMLVAPRPQKVASRSVTQQFPNVLRNPEVHYRVHEAPQRIPILLFNILLPPTSRPSHLSLSFWLSHQNPRLPLQDDNFTVEDALTKTRNRHM
jgi:hypothetical protein